MHLYKKVLYEHRCICAEDSIEIPMRIHWNCLINFLMWILWLWHWWNLTTILANSNRMHFKTYAHTPSKTGSTILHFNKTVPIHPLTRKHGKRIVKDSRQIKTTLQSTSIYIIEYVKSFVLLPQPNFCFLEQKKITFIDFVASTFHLLQRVHIVQCT